MSKRRPPSRRHERGPNDKGRKPRTLNERLAWATGAFVTVWRHYGKPDHAIRLAVHKALEDAFEGNIEDHIKTIEINGKEEDVMSNAGTFMLILKVKPPGNEPTGLDLNDPYVQERISAIVDRCLEYSISHPGDWLHESA